jgi:hypothetical protein
MSNFVPCGILGLLGRQKDVAATDATEIAKGNEHGYAYSLLAAGRQVVANEHDQNDKGSVEAGGDKEEVGHARYGGIRDGQLGDQPDDGNGDKVGALLVMVA